MDARDVWFGKNLSARASRLALSPLSLLYGLGWQTYLGIYRLGIKRPAEPHCPVLCVGNLMIGGTGKSPVSAYLASLLAGQVVISASGYGAPHAEGATLAPEGPLKASEWGDEPAMFRWLLPNVPLIVGRRRPLAAQICHENFADSVLLMDDGFQHLPVRKHVSVLLDPVQPSNRLCLPAGPYREPRFNRRRADAVLPGQWNVVPKPLQFVTPSGQMVPKPDSFSVLCGLGQPQRFLESLSVEPQLAALLPDHDPMTAGNLLERLPAGLPVVVTAKDWVKLRERADVDSRQFIIARHEVTVEPEESFRNWLVGKLDEFRS